MGEIHMKALQKLEGVQVISINSRTDEGGKGLRGKMEDPISIDPISKNALTGLALTQ